MRGCLQGLPDPGFPPGNQGSPPPFRIGCPGASACPRPGGVVRGGCVEGVGPPTPAGSCLLGGTRQHPPQRPSQPRGAGPAGWAGTTKVPDGRKFPLRTHPRAAHNGARRPAAKCVSARAGLQLPDIPAARAPGRFQAVAILSGRLGAADEDKATRKRAFLHPCPPPPAVQRGKGGHLWGRGGCRCTSDRKVPTTPAWTSDARPGGRPRVGVNRKFEQGGAGRRRRRKWVRIGW